MKRKIWFILFAAALLAMLPSLFAPAASEAAADHYASNSVQNLNRQASGCAGVYDRGWIPHAQGSVSPPNLYYVIRGDTWYSIGRRFGVSVRALRRANGLYYPYAYQWVVIPCLNVGPWYPPYPPPPPPPPPVYPTPSPAPAHIVITSPLNNAVLPPTFVVSGAGGNLPEGNVVVRARLLDGSILAEKATVLQGSNVGTGGEGAWSVELAVNAPAGVAGVT